MSTKNGRSQSNIIFNYKSGWASIDLQQQLSTGASIPPNTLAQVPPSPSPSPSPPFPLLSHPFPLPSPFLRSRPPLLWLGGLGERFSSPSGSGQSPAAKRYLVNFRLKISFLQKLRGGSALIINALPPKFLQKRSPLLFPWCICSIVYME